MTRLILSIILMVACGALAYGAEGVRPKPDDITKFVAEPIASNNLDYFKDFKVTKKDFSVILKEYFQVEEEHWKHGYSHVGLGDRSGHLILKDGSKVRWTVRPGGLAWLEFPRGKKIYLAREKTEWPFNK